MQEVALTMLGDLLSKQYLLGFGDDDDVAIRKALRIMGALDFWDYDVSGLTQPCWHQPSKRRGRP